jgi:glycosyltransferase involved in cell wall biosynthesis
MSSPSVSVCMPVYNTERYVAEAVESILAQTFGDFEFIIIDDGSTDGSRAILERYAKQDDRIRLISRPNTGIAGARNEALGLARGELIAVMDSDDVALPERFEVQVAYLREHPEVVCLGSVVQCIDEAGRYLFESFHLATDHEAMQEMALRGQCPLAHPSMMMRREAVLAVNGYDPEFGLAEDHDLILRLGERGKLANLPQALQKYRWHDQSISAKKQALQADRGKLAVLRAWERRGIERRDFSVTPWRPTNRHARFEYAVRFGWTGYMRGDREMAQVYAAKALRLIPWRSDGWRLLACIVLKLGRRKILSSTGPGGY